MANKAWIPVDVYFLSNGFPFTHERKEIVAERLARMGYRLKKPKRSLEMYEKLMGGFYKGKDTVHIIRIWKKKKNER